VLSHCQAAARKAPTAARECAWRTASHPIFVTGVGPPRACSVSRPARVLRCSGRRSTIPSAPLRLGLDRITNHNMLCAMQEGKLRPGGGEVNASEAPCGVLWRVPESSGRNGPPIAFLRLRRASLHGTSPRMPATHDRRRTG